MPSMVEVVGGRGGRVSDWAGESFDEFLSATQSGAGWAAERLWTPLAPALAGYLAARGAAKPDDLTTEVFLGVFPSLGTFSGSEEQFRSWMFTIANRRLTNERRRTRCRPPPAGGLEAEDGPPSPTAEHVALHRLSVERVLTLCDRLVPDQRDVKNGATRRAFVPPRWVLDV